MVSHSDQKIEVHTPSNVRDEYWMRKALRLADMAEKKSEIPVGAVLVGEHGAISAGHNLSITLHDPSAHAEMIAIRRAGNKLSNYRLINTTLYVTLEPCPMCAGLLVHSRISRLVYGAADGKTGAAGSVLNLCENAKLNHQVAVTGGVLAELCGNKLSQFFRQRRKAIKAHKSLSKL